MIFMTKFLNTREIQLEEKKILDEVVKFLDKNKIKYFLTYGTLIGAIRHKGFIPWDDDIDIAVPRDDYQKLVSLFKNNNLLGNNLYFHSYELGNLNMPFAKVYKHDIKVYDWRYNDKYEKYLWIDIFPIDGFPDDKIEFEKWNNKKNLIRTLIMYRKMSIKYMFKDKKKFLINIPKLISKIVLNILPERFLSKKIVKLTEKYPYDKSKYAGCYVWSSNLGEKMLKKDFEEYTKVDFEGSKYNALKKYDKYLSQVYGDYMTLPPEEKRITHNFKAWRVDENEKEIKK